jgi:ATP-binding cassette subfamily B protein
VANIIVLAVVFGLTNSLSPVLSNFASYSSAVVKQRLTVLTEHRLFDRITSFIGLRYFEDPSFYDRLALAEQASQSAPSSISSSFLQSIQAIILITSFFGSILLIWPPFAVFLALSSVPAVLLQTMRANELVAAIEKATPIQRRASYYRTLFTDPPAAREARLFGFGSHLHRRYIEALDTSTRALLNCERRNTITQGVLSLVSGCLATVGIAFVAYHTALGQFTIGDLTLFLASVGAVQSGISILTFQITAITSAVHMFPYYLDLLNQPNDLLPGTQNPSALEYGIEIHDVWFRYDSETPWILRGVDLFIPANQSTGLVGANGAGKTTLVKLLCRFYDPDRGRITWDGTDIRDFDPVQLRARITATFQDFAEYELTAFENIEFGSLGCCDDANRIDRIRDAARLAEIDSTLNDLQNGYQTVLSRSFYDDDEGKGTTLSGGQWQRLALARTLMRDNAEFLILDEPNSGLDPIAEHNIHTTIRNWHIGRTALLVSHRLGATRDADMIVVLSEGRVVERGTHETLMRSNGLYAKLFAIQAGPYLETDTVASNS